MITQRNENKYTPFGIVYSAILLLCVIAFYIIVSHNRLPYIGCPFKIITGIPCPTCGATRMSLAFLHLDIVKAVLYNPMLALGLLAIPVWGIHDIMVLSGKIRPITLPKQCIRWGVVGIFVLNWAYLIIMKI